MDVQVISVGAASGAWRLDVAEVAEAWDAAGRGHIAVAAPDEDALTLAWDAADRALRAAGVAPHDVTGLWWGTSRPPFAEGPTFAYLATALSLPRDVTGALFGGSPHAGIEALLAAWDAVASGAASRALVVASDALVPGLGTAFERRAAAGAVAVVLAAAGGSARLVRRTSRLVAALDRYRGDLERSTRDVYDPRLFRERVFVPGVAAVAAALAPDDVTAWSLPDPDGRLGAAIAKKLPGDTASAPVFAALGDTGAAAALLGATPALDAAGVVGVIAYGGGRTTGLVAEVSAPVAGAAAAAAVATTAAPRRASYAQVLRAREQLVAAGESVAMGVPPGSALLARGADELLGLLGARCVDCGTISTPPSVHPTCIGCGSDKLEDVPLVRHGAVHTFVVNQTMPAPFVAPLTLAVVDLDDGARLMIQVTGDPTGLAIGDEVELVLRRYALERGAPVYGYKARRVKAADAEVQA